MAQVTLSTAPGPLVTGPARVPVPYGLFSVLGFTQPGTPHWQQGVRWEDLGSTEVGVIGAPSCEPATPTVGLPKSFPRGGLELADAEPFTVYGSYLCSPIGNDLGFAEDTAELRLTTFEERGVERHLWEGEFADADSVGDTSLTELVYAIATLEQHLADEYGSLGVLHVNREIGTLVQKQLGFDFRGGRAFTPLGTPVVIGQGYGSDAIVATGALFGFRSEIFTSSNRQGDLLNRDQNDLYSVAERTYLVGYDVAARIEIS